MTITTFRIYYEAKTPGRAKKLSGSHWGFATWFKRRLKPIREQLRGPEAKGVDIVNLMLYERLSMRGKETNGRGGETRFNSISFVT